MNSLNMKQINELLQMEKDIGAKITTELSEILTHQIDHFFQLFKPSGQISSRLLQLSEEAHKLKSSCLNLGMQESARHLGLIEKYSSEKDKDISYDNLIINLEQITTIEFGLLQEYLRDNG